MDLVVEPQVIIPGKPVTIRWQVEADEVVLWHNPIAALSPEPENWSSIGRQGNAVEQSGQIEIPLEHTTAFYIVARSARGVRGLKVISELATEERKVKATTWSPQSQYMPLMEDRSVVKWAPERSRPLWETLIPQLKSLANSAEAWDAGLSATLTAAPQVIFEDESATLSWNVVGANCVNMAFGHHSHGLVADTSNVSGTKTGGGGWGGGGTPPCGIQNGPGSSNVTSQMTNGPSHARASLRAESPVGPPVDKWCWIDLLSVPKFKGASAQRQTEIRNAIREIDTRLRGGCIYNDTSLDSKVDAFKKGHLNRKHFWFSLMSALQNIGIVTFVCQDVSDSNWGAGHWTDYTNEIILEWSPSHTPYLEYVILHELCHKVGFNGSLRAYYSHNEIETQAHLLSGACYP
jgi:hypothetical protein